MKKEFFVYSHNSEIIAYDANLACLQGILVNEFEWPDNEPDADLHELEIEVIGDSLYIEGWNENFGEDTEIFSIVNQNGFDLTEWEYVETEFVGSGKYRTIFHRIN